MKQTGASYQDTAIEFNMNNPSLNCELEQKFSKEGIEGLKEKAKGHGLLCLKKKNETSETRKNNFS